MFKRSYGTFSTPLPEFLSNTVGSRYPDKYRNGLDFPYNETPYIPDRICPDNETPLFIIKCLLGLQQVLDAA